MTAYFINEIKLLENHVTVDEKTIDDYEKLCFKVTSKMRAAMPVTQDKPAPYATTSSILDILSRYRNRGLPFPVNAEVLARVGISESLIPRTLQSLKTLDLINDLGNPTEALEGIRLAPEAEYKKRLEAWLKGTYAEIFSIVDPTKDDSVRIRDAFRGFEPVGQQDRMVALFEGLCSEAGLIESKVGAAHSSPIPRQKSSLSPRARRNLETLSGTGKRDSGINSTGIPAPLLGLLAGLPPKGDGWTADERKKFLATFEAVLDFCFPVVKEKKETAA